MDVTLVRWPTEEERRSRLEESDQARLLLVEMGQDPPPPSDCLQDWIRVPASEADVAARVAGLAQRGQRHVSAVPSLDDDGVLHFRTGWVALPPVEMRLTRSLVDRYGAVVGREAITRAGWPSGAPQRNALDVHILRLRRRLAPVGLAIRTIRSRGYLLEESDSVQEDARHA